MANSKLNNSYPRFDDDRPEKVYECVRGSHNGLGRKSKLTVYEYPNRDVCIQLEDQESGAEMWWRWEGLEKMFAELKAISTKRRKQRVGRSKRGVTK